VLGKLIRFTTVRSENVNLESVPKLTVFGNSQKLVALWLCVTWLIKAKNEHPSNTQNLFLGCSSSKNSHAWLLHNMRDFALLDAAALCCGQSLVYTVRHR
jgi:hypothetical protein